eukprot:gene4634-9198_t
MRFLSIAAFMCLVSCSLAFSGISSKLRTQPLKENHVTNVIQYSPHTEIKRISTMLMTKQSDQKDSEGKVDGLEPKYFVALLVFFAACVYDKMVMHGGF